VIDLVFFKVEAQLFHLPIDFMHMYFNQFHHLEERENDENAELFLVKEKLDALPRSKQQVWVH
jgi:hypothetical protein